MARHSDRFPDWQCRLGQYLEHCARTPFSWGTHDCALFLAGAVAAMTGHDYAAQFRGRYSTSSEGMRLLRTAGHASHVDLVAASLSECTIALARPGDAVLIGRSALGVVQGAHAYVLREDGLGLMPMADATAVWKV